MDFAFDEQEREISGLARKILEDRVTNERLKEHEASGDPFDAALWRDLADADVLGVGVPEGDGGLGLGFLALTLVLREVGRTVAPVPAYAALVLGALPLAQFGDDRQRAWLPEIVRGERIVTAALLEPGSTELFAPTTRADATADEVRLHGTKTLVPYAEQASHLIVPATDQRGEAGLYVVALGGDGIAIEQERTPDRQPYARVVLDSAATESRLGDGDSLRWLVERAMAARCMMQLGVVEQALRMTGAYSRERVQFDRPIGAFQAVHQRAADAYVQVEAIRLTAWEAAWRLSVDMPASNEVLVAKYHAAEGGQFASYATQHLHGGVGIDVDYPLHRYFLWAIQLEHELGSARHQLERLGKAVAARTAGSRV